MTAELATKQSLPMSNGMVQCNSLEDAYRFAKAISASRLAPNSFDTPEKILIALQIGAELGLKPMQSLQNIAVVNGRPSVYGKALPGVVLPTGLMEVFEEWIEGEGDNQVARCKLKRKGMNERVDSFSVADAKKAGLWGKSGPWSSYPREMLKYRARSRGFNALFADVLCGLHVYEDIQDIPPERRDDTPPPVQEDPLLKQVSGTIEVKCDTVNETATPIHEDSSQVAAEKSPMAQENASPPASQPAPSADSKPKKSKVSQPKEKSKSADTFSGAIDSVVPLPGNKFRINTKDGDSFYTDDAKIKAVIVEKIEKGEDVTFSFDSKDGREFITVLI
jgi:hypothetical protein